MKFAPYYKTKPDGLTYIEMVVDFHDPDPTTNETIYYYVWGKKAEVSGGYDSPVNADRLVHSTFEASLLGRARTLPKEWEGYLVELNINTDGGHFNNEDRDGYLGYGEIDNGDKHGRMNLNLPGDTVRDLLLFWDGFHLGYQRTWENHSAIGFHLTELNESGSKVSFSVLEFSSFRIDGAFRVDQD